MSNHGRPGLPVFIAFAILHISTAARSLAFEIEKPGIFVRPVFAARKVINLTLSGKVHDTMSVPFVPHSGDGPFSNYLAMNIPYEPVKRVYSQVKKGLRLKKLKTRGEAHITVITPVEYHKVLAAHLSIGEINEIAENHSMQSAPFKVICLGSGWKIINHRKEETFFIVVNSPALLAIRRAVNEKFIDNGGRRGAFVPSEYYPHITVGFTKRDLHESDGVIKNPASRDPRFNLLETQ